MFPCFCVIVSNAWQSGGHFTSKQFKYVIKIWRKKSSNNNNNSCVYMRLLSDWFTGSLLHSFLTRSYKLNSGSIPWNALTLEMGFIDLNFSTLDQTMKSERKTWSKPFRSWLKFELMHWLTYLFVCVRIQRNEISVPTNHHY